MKILKCLVKVKHHARTNANSAEIANYARENLANDSNCAKNAFIAKVKLIKNNTRVVSIPVSKACEFVLAAEKIANEHEYI